MDDSTPHVAPSLDEDATAAQTPPLAPRANWLSEGMRVLGFRAPHWERLDGRPRVVALLFLAGYLASFVIQRALIDGPATPAWSGFLNGWAATALSVWLCWLACSAGGARGAAVAGSGTLVALLAAATVVLSTAFGLALLLLTSVAGPIGDWPLGVRWGVWLLPMAWAGLATIRLLWRVAPSRLARLAAVVLTPVSVAISGWLQPAVLWWPQPAAEKSAYAGLPLNDEVIAAQATLLGEALDALRPPQVGRVNVYAATYAPYASQDVFMRESAVVTRTMRDRFGTEGRTVELVMNPATGTTLPWATPANLRRTIARFAAVMDRDRDVLFLHLSSHGGADGRLAVDSWPLDMPPMTPSTLKQWLDESGIRWRVISISACYSGSWIGPLAGDGTLVMTAADATHTSYGCGSRSPLTFFGQAMYVDALRSTRSFAAAHAQARQLIQSREITAGKSDGYSNPQISMGAGIEKQLQRLEDEQQGR